MNIDHVDVRRLRIPLTQEQKQLITDATADEPEGMAAWARALLLAAAKKRMAKVANQERSADE